MAITAKQGSSRWGWLAGIGLTILLAVPASYLATLPILKTMGVLSVTLLLGITWRTILGLPMPIESGVKFSARTLLRFGIVLMGARLNYSLILTAGPKILLVDTLVIVCGISGIYLLSRRFGLPKELGLLVAVGSSICGASAVAAAAPVANADEESTTLAVALMGILGTLGVFFYVFVGPHLGLSLQALGVLTGSTLQEVAQVMAAAFTWGSQSGDMGTLVKLTRVVLLAPALLVIASLLSRKKKTGLAFSWKEPPLPYFVLGFLFVGGLNTFGVLSGAWQGWLTQASIYLMAFAMGGMGLRTDLGVIRREGRKAALVGGIGFFSLALLSYTMIRLLGIS